MNYICKRMISALLCALLLFNCASLKVFAAEETYTVAVGDTLSRIAAKFGLTVKELAEYNNIKDANRISIGQTLKLPGRESASPSDTGAGKAPAETTAAETVPPTAVKITDAETTENRKKGEATVKPSAGASTPGTSAYISTLAGMDAKISINFQRTDLRDVLSAFAVSLGYNIILKGTATTITIALTDVTIGEALDYVMKLASMTYIVDGRTIIIGTKANITSAFAEKLQLTEFRLAYVRADAVTSNIRTLGIDVKTAPSGDNEYAFIAEGLPVDLARVRDLVAMLDRAENAGVSEPSGLAQSLYVLETANVTADEAATILASVSLPTGVVLPAKPKTLYLYASKADYESVKKVIELVDTPYPETAEEAQTIERVDLAYVTVDLVEAPLAANSSAALIKVSTNSRALWLSGTKDDIAGAKKIIELLDVAENSAAAGNSSSLHMVTLRYITASQFAEALEIIGLPGIGVNFEVNKNTLYIFGTDEQFEAIQAVAASLDTPENASLAAEEQTTSFRAIWLNFITAEQFSQALAAISVTGGIIFESNPSTLYLWATDDDFATIERVRAVVDTQANAAASAVNPMLHCINLSYITAKQFAEALSALQLPSTGLIFDSNPYSYYTWATNSELDSIFAVKMSIDTQANASALVAGDSPALYAVELTYLTAKQFSETLSSMSLPSGLLFEDNTQTLYVWATPDEYNSVINVKNVVDTLANSSKSSVAKSQYELRKVTLTNTTKEFARSIVESLNLGVTVIDSESFRSVMWLYGTKSSVDAAELAVNNISAGTSPDDVLDAVDIYPLENIKAAEMAEMFDSLALVNVKAYTFTLPQFSNQIIIAYSSDMKATVERLIKKLDVSSTGKQRVTLMIDSSADEDGRALLNNRIWYIREMMGLNSTTSEATFEISENISKESKKFLFILYLKNATMAEVQLARDIVADLDSAGAGGSEEKPAETTAATTVAPGNAAPLPLPGLLPMP